MKYFFDRPTTDKGLDLRTAGRAGGLKIAVPAEGPDLEARVSDRLGLSPYLLIVDLESKRFEALRSPREPLSGAGSGAGMQMVALIIAKKGDVLLTDWCSPTAEKYLSAYGVEIVGGMSGTVAKVLDEFQKERKNPIENPESLGPVAWKIERRDVASAMRNASNQVKHLLPVVIGVIFLVGLLNAFLSKDVLTSFFSGGIWRDSLWGASIGSVFTGNPINSYIIGGQLLDLGVSLIAVTAFICSWVTVGLIQLPAEIAALGWKFSVVRNFSCFVLSIAISFVMMPILNFFGI
jgi:predicted Fe-Mo cluster-binding NifX family protein